jgi:hypothetical protein
MKRLTVSFVFLFFIFYTILFLALNISCSQEQISYYFADISGPVIFYAVNTTFSVLLLWSTGLIFFLCFIIEIETTKELRRIAFYFSQIIVFWFLAADQRFMLHDFLGEAFQIHKAYILLFWGCLEGLALTWSESFHKASLLAKFNIFIGAFLFFCMFLVSAFIPPDVIMFETTKDMLKIWSSLFILLFSFSFFIVQVKEKYLMHPSSIKKTRR